MTQLTVKVLRRTQEAEGIVAFELARPDGAALPAFSAGDFRINGGSFLRVAGGDGTAISPYRLVDVYGLQGIGSFGSSGSASGASSTSSSTVSQPESRAAHSASESSAVPGTSTCPATRWSASH